MHLTLEPDQLYVSVDVLIMTIREGRLSVLISRRTQAPYQHCWALPGRLVAVDESAEVTAQRLLSEMLCVRETYLEQLFTFTAVGRDPRGRVISVAYLAVVPWPALEPLLTPENTSLRCFGIRQEGGVMTLEDADGTQLRGSDLAFDHGDMIAACVTRLQGKLDYTELGFRFLRDPQQFTLAELQGIYEAIWGRALDTSNFRRTILSRYEESGRIGQTDQLLRQKKGRPAAIYRLKQ